MVRRSVLALLMAVTGCDSVFGLDHIQHEVTGSWQRQYMYNNANHTPILDVLPYAPSDITRVEVRSGSGESLPIAWDYTAGTFRFATQQDALYRLTVFFARGDVVEIQSRAAALAVADSFFSRPDVLPAAPGTTVGGTISPTGTITTLTSTGVWSSTEIAGSVGSYSIPWTLPPLRASEHDRVYVTRRTLMVDSYVLTQAASYDLEMVDGAATTLDVVLEPISQPYCAHLILERAAELDRVKAAYPDHVDSDSTAWTLRASPNRDLGPTFLLLLASSATTVDDTTVRYATPFTGFGTIITMGTQRMKQVTEPVSVKRYAGTISSFEIEDSISCERYTAPSGLVALSVNPRLAGTALESDGMTITVPASGQLELTWDADGAADSFFVSLNDVTDSQTAVQTRRFRTVEPRLVLDAEMFERDHVYYFGINAILGNPAAATGDFVTLAYPFATSYVNAPVFTVTR